MKTFSLRKSERLLGPADFGRLSKHGNRIDSDYFIVLYSRNSLGRLRLGITASKRVGRAAIRNRVKRLVREHFRLHKDLLSDGYDVNVIAKGGASDLSSRQISVALEAIVGDILRDCKHEAVSAGTH
ncbi:MAG: ribonuclease P protein component [Desulfobacterales bacterium]|nr:ribonuclease P protein component [Desulfobacterales bacterium]